MSIERISELSEVDPWFLYKIQNIIMIEKELKAHRSERVAHVMLTVAVGALTVFPGLAPMHRR